MKHLTLAILLAVLAFMIGTYLENVGLPHWTGFFVISSSRSDYCF